MKKILLCILTCMSGLNSFAQGSNGLIAHWDFNGNANDISGHNLHGVVYGCKLVAGVANIPATAYNVSNLVPTTNLYDHIQVAYDPLFDVSKYSICAVINIDSFTHLKCQRGIIFSKGNIGSTSSYALYYDDNEYDNDCNVYNPGKINFVGNLDDAASKLPKSSRGYSTYIKVGQWYCVTSTFDGDTLKQYINGALYSKVLLHGLETGGGSVTNIRIGANAFAHLPTSQQDTSYHMYGSVDDVRLYDRALSAAEVNQYCTAFNLTTPPAEVKDIALLKPMVVPNPVQDKLTVVLPTVDDNATVQITNALGQVIANAKLTGESVVFNIDDQPSGTYIVRAYYRGAMIYTKFLKE